MGLNRGGILLAVLVLPLYVPVLVFGAGVVGALSAFLATAIIGLSLCTAAYQAENLDLFSFGNLSDAEMRRIGQLTSEK